MSNVVKVAAFGSCRIFTPLARARSQGFIETTHTGIEWYTHSTLEALQKADIVECLRPVPDEIIPLLIDTKEKHNEEFHTSNKFDDTDVIVLEISTLKKIEFEGWYLQQWRVANLKSGQATDAPEEAVRIARAAVITEVLADEFLEHLEAFRLRLGKPLLIVPHLTCPFFPEAVLRPRLKIRRLIEKFCEQHEGAVMYDPTPTIVAHGEEVALVDSGHYQPPFNKVIGAELGAACRALHLQLA